MHSAVSSRPTGIPRVRTVTLDHPWRWLSAGWLDITTTPGVSFTYGALFTVAGFLLLAGLNRLAMDYLILPLALGFALIGPAAAVGLYETSRRMMTGRDATLGDALGAFRRNPAQIGLVGVFLALAFIAWVRLAVLEFMLFFGSSPPPLDGFVSALLMSDQSVAFLAVGTLTGAAMAALVFAMTAIAIPMLVDRPEIDAMTAMLTSLEAVRVNAKPMALWAFLIAFFTFFGLSMFFIGLALTLPLIGHASWHAYRDLVVRED